MPMFESCFMKSKWIVNLRPKSSAVMRLICFPYAGGDASVFRHWVNALPEELEVLAIQLPGRASRLLEPPLVSMPEIIEELQSEILPYLSKPYIFLGHSLGSRIAFELTHRLRRNHQPLPYCFVASGSNAPDTKSNKTHGLSDAEFIDELRALGGTPDDILNHEEMMSLLLPMLRADFGIAKTYNSGTRKPLDMPVALFNGTSDIVDEERLQKAWQRHFSMPIQYFSFDGGHFFINEKYAEFIKVLRKYLQEIPIL